MRNTDNGQKEKTLSRIYRMGLYVSISLLVTGEILHRLGLDLAKVGALGGTTFLVFTPIAGLLFLSFHGMREGNRKTTLTSMGLIALIAAAVSIISTFIK